MRVQFVRSRTACAGAALLSLWVATESALGAAEPPRLEEVAVYGRAQQQIGSARSASEGLVGYDDIQLPPLLRVGELVEAVPGMVATQHSGTGKANQYFLRGFNLDHGTDFSAHVGGVPVNLRSHGHGQGYLDLNFLIPELVETTAYRKGPYAAAVGDFASAGSVQFSIYERLPESMLQATVGEFDYGRVLAAGSTETGATVFTGALDVTTYDGPWERDENLKQYKAHLALGRDIGDARLRLAYDGYDSRWDATDQIPRRAVSAGRVGRLGFIDPDLGGETSRHSLAAQLSADSWSAGVYTVDYRFQLYSNFTYALENADDGDEFEQRDRRRMSGAWIRGTRTVDLFTRDLRLNWGGDLRYDDIGEVGLYATRARQRLALRRNDRVEELSYAVFGEAELALTESLRVTAGLRADVYDWSVDAFRPANGGTGDDSLLTPRFSAAWRIGDAVETYASWGRGFHSNDVRGATISVDPISGEAVDPVDVLVASEGAELGLRVESGRAFNATLAVFWLALDSELLYVGDAGTTEPNGATERYGVEATVFWRPTAWLALNAAYTYTDAAFKQDQGGRDIPGAVPDTFTLGANASWQNGFSASARLRYLGDAPLAEDGAVRSDASWLLNGGAAWRRGQLELRADIFNILDSQDDDIAYFYASRLTGEAAPVEDVHFHPLEPRSVRFTATYYFGG